MVRKLLFGFWLSIVFIQVISAQAPQAICYQAVAKDNLGNNIIETTIGIQAAVLKGGPNGIAEWIETFTPKTDQFGLFTVNIGEGTRAGGIQTQFDSLQWGAGVYWLQISMDIDGGQDYLLMGSNRMLSVPYAIYSNRTETAASALNALFADSSATANYANQAQQAQFSDSTLVSSYAHEAGNAQTALTALSTLGDDDQSPTNELQDLLYQNDSLYLQSQAGNLSQGFFIPNQDADHDTLNELQTLIVQNDLLHLQTSSGNISGIGIQIDQDSTNELQSLDFDGKELSLSNGNSIMLMDEQRPFSAVGASFDLPQGILGEHIVLGLGDFQVPANKNFYVMASGPSIKLKNYGNPPFHDLPTTPNMPAFPANTEIEDCMCTGVLIDTSASIHPIIIDFISGAGSFSVPPGKILFIKSGMKNDQAARLIVNGAPMEFLRPNLARGTRIITFPPGTELEPFPVNQTIDLVLTGFLIDENL